MVTIYVLFLLPKGSSKIDANFDGFDFLLPKNTVKTSCLHKERGNAH
jgi:hypothetical protein